MDHRANPWLEKRLFRRCLNCKIFQLVCLLSDVGLFSGGMQWILFGMAGCSVCIRTPDTRGKARQKLTFSTCCFASVLAHENLFFEVKGSMVVSQASNVIKWLIEINEFFATLF